MPVGEERRVGIDQVDLALILRQQGRHHLQVISQDQAVSRWKHPGSPAPVG